MSDEVSGTQGPAQTRQRIHVGYVGCLVLLLLGIAAGAYRVLLAGPRIVIAASPTEAMLSPRVLEYNLGLDSVEVTDTVSATTILRARLGSGKRLDGFVVQSGRDMALQFREAGWDLEAATAVVPAESGHKYWVRLSGNGGWGYSEATICSVKLGQGSAAVHCGLLAWVL